MRGYHIAGIAVVLAFAGIALAFAGGFLAHMWGGSPTQTTEIILIVAIVGAIVLALTSITTEGREGRSMRSTRGALRPHHVGWFLAALIVSLLVAAGAGAWATINEGADVVSSGIISLLVFLLALLVSIAVLGAMRAEHHLRRKA